MSDPFESEFFEFEDAGNPDLQRNRIVAEFEQFFAELRNLWERKSRLERDRVRSWLVTTVEFAEEDVVLFVVPTVVIRVPGFKDVGVRPQDLMEAIQRWDKGEPYLHKVDEEFFL